MVNQHADDAGTIQKKVTVVIREMQSSKIITTRMVTVVLYGGMEQNGMTIRVWVYGSKSWSWTRVRWSCR